MSGCTCDYNFTCRACLAAAPPYFYTPNSVDSATEADEAARDKPTALDNFREQVAKGEAMGVIDMYERAARTVGATDEEIRAAREAAKVEPRSVYAECVEAGMLVEHHESDLYVKDTIEARAILERHGSKFSTFVSDGERWIDVPFAFDPFWKAAKEAP